MQEAAKSFVMLDDDHEEGPDVRTTYGRMLIGDAIERAMNARGMKQPTHGSVGFYKIRSSRR
jgi:hypothetical protein